MVELYYNSNQFVYTLPVLEREFSSPFAMFEKLAAYYEEKGYFVNSPARGYRYQVLLDFVQSRVQGSALEEERSIAQDESQGEVLRKEELFAELLTFDYYLRENAKSRPPFAKELSPWREQIWQFYCKEEEHPNILTAYSSYHARQTMKMTHMEVFYYPVWDGQEKKEMVRQDKPFFVLFDYAERDVLTVAAKIYLIN